MMGNSERLEKALEKMPLVAILRGLLPENAEAVGHTLVNSGITVIEVPLNSPEPYKSIRILRDTLGEHIVIGAGTVVETDDVIRVRDAGGEIVVTPNTSPKVIGSCIKLGIVPMPGVATATEAFSAIDAGASYLKIFPANMFPVGYPRALLSVLPKHVQLLAVGGIDHTNSADYLAAGCRGLGLGSCLFKSSMTQEEVRLSADQLVSSIKGCQ